MARRTLFIESGRRDSADLAIEMLRGRSSSEDQVVRLSQARSGRPAPADADDAVAKRVVGSDLRSLLRAAIGLRRQRFSTVAALFAGGGRYRRLKLLAIAVGGPSLLIFDENGDSFRCGNILRLTRHVALRICRRVGHLVIVRLGVAAIRSLAQDGPRASLRRARGHLERPSRRPPIPVRLRRHAETLVFPGPTAPRVSIVVPARDRWIYTYNCLLSVLERTGDVAYEVIVVDDGSTDRTPELLSRIRNIRVVRLDPGRGFVAACNLGAEQARGEAIAFLNNDVLVCPGWLSAMLRLLDRNATCGAVGAKQLAPSGVLLEAGGIVWRDGTAWNCGRGERADGPEHNYVREVDYVSAAALLVRTEAFRMAGGFDERYAPGYWEDTDLCFALREHGWRTFYQPAAVAVHFEGVSAGRSTRRGMKRFQETNRPKFRAKWQNRLAEQPDIETDDLFVARDRNRGRRILVVDQYVPTWDRDAGSFFMLRFLEVLRRLGCRVVFWPDDRARLPGYTETLQQLGIEVAYGHAPLEDFVRSHARSFDAAVGHRWHIVARHLDTLRPFVPRLLFLAADLESLREQRRIAVEDGSPDVVGALRRRERRVLAACNRAAVHSSIEQDMLRRTTPNTPIDLIPLPVADRPIGSGGFAGRDGMLFVGSSHPPNLDALRFYLDRIAPVLARLHTGAKLHVVGGVCDALVGADGGRDGVALHGYVPALERHLDRARVFLAPLRYGAGVKGKILEAMQAGVPVVTTTIGAEGIPLVDGESALIADTAEDIAAAAARLLSDPVLWESLRRNARKVVEKHHSSGAFEAAVTSTLSALWSTDAGPLAGSQMSAGGEEGARGPVG